MFKRLFTFRAPKIWNSITNDIRETNSYDCFKRKLTKSEDLHKITFDSSSIYRALNYNDFVYRCVFGFSAFLLDFEFLSMFPDTIDL